MLRLGTSGWSYREWRGVLYTAGMPQTLWLQRYAQTFSTVELNAAFYRLPAAGSIDGWREGVPSGFAFAVKASQYLTHRRTPPAATEIESFITHMARLGDRLGPLLFQFPPTRKRDDGWLEAYLAALPAGGQYAMEFRHASWHDDGVYAMLERRGIALCLADQGGAEMPCVRTAGFGYARFRGYEGEPRRYPPKTLDAAIARIAALFDPAEETFIYFHHGVAGLEDALRLRESVP
ncbi:MAG: DUF72 domain-containing protein [bacterium]|nr:DUF72 domain-containing protein [bacterium]